jgi:type I restriction enzyme M protein
LEAKNNREQVDILQLNEDISLIVEKINKLRVDIDLIINEIEA